MKLPIIIIALMAGMAVPKFSKAQAFFTPGVTAFTPQINVVSTGVVQDVQATVTADRKYVTMTMRPQQSQLLNLFQFSFNGPNIAGGLGFVGGVSFVPGGTVVTGTFDSINPPVELAPGNGEQILAQRGMTPILLKN